MDLNTETTVSGFLCRAMTLLDLVFAIGIPSATMAKRNGVCMMAQMLKEVEARGAAAEAGNELKRRRFGKSDHPRADAELANAMQSTVERNVCLSVGGERRQRERRRQILIPGSIALVAAFLAFGEGASVPSTPARADDCLAAPNSPAPLGSHWYYHTDRADQRKCWYLRRSEEPSQHASEQPKLQTPMASLKVGAPKVGAPLSLMSPFEASTPAAFPSGV
ncbi:MAG TPA: hypothetical protein VGJ20_37690, partial [Xanthobacteraceae bacterium]